MMERRRSIRQTPIVGRAFVYIGKGIPLINCDVMNISEGGARIVPKTPEMLPAQFVLFLTLDGSERRTCRVVWRDGFDVGVAFEGLD
jgi:PilZ domain